MTHVLNKLIFYVISLVACFILLKLMICLDEPLKVFLVFSCYAFVTLKANKTLDIKSYNVYNFICCFQYTWQSPTPAPYVKETLDAAQFYMNRVLKDFKEKWVSNCCKISTCTMCIPLHALLAYDVDRTIVVQDVQPCACLMYQLWCWIKFILIRWWLITWMCNLFLLLI